jgi:hypothetical protein
VTISFSNDIPHQGVSKYLTQVQVLLRGKVKVKLSLCLTKHYAMKTYWGSVGVGQVTESDVAVDFL